MPPVVKDRNNPTRGTASESTYSLMELCPKCKETRTFHLPQRPSVADTTNGPVGAGSESSSGMNITMEVLMVLKALRTAQEILGDLRNRKTKRD